MKFENIEDNIIAYFEGELGEQEQQSLKELVAKDDDLQGVWKSYAEVYNLIDGQEYELPSNDMTAVYQTWLSKEIANNAQKNDLSSNKIIQLSTFRKIAALAAGLAILIFGWNAIQTDATFDVSQNNNKQDLALMINQESTTDRIKAIRVSNNQNDQEPNHEMLQMFFKVLHHDESSNVRLAAVDALAPFIENENVRVGLLKTLGTEQDGFVKLAMVNLLAQNQDEKVKQTFENLVQDETQEKFVKDEVYLHLIQY